MSNQKESELQIITNTFNLGYVSPLAIFTCINLLMLNFFIFRFFLVQLDLTGYNCLLTLFQMLIIIFTKNVNNDIKTFSVVNVISVFFSIIINTVLIGIFMIGFISFVNIDLLGLNQTSILYMNTTGLSTTQLKDLKSDVLDAVTAKALQGIQVVSYKDLLSGDMPKASPYSYACLYVLCFRNKVDYTSIALTKVSEGTYAKSALITQLLSSQ